MVRVLAGVRRAAGLAVTELVVIAVATGSRAVNGVTGDRLEIAASEVGLTEVGLTEVVTGASMVRRRLNSKS